MNLKRRLKDLFLFGIVKKRRKSVWPFLRNSWYDMDLNPYLERFIKSTDNKDEGGLKRGIKIRMSSGVGIDKRSPGPYRDASYTMALYESNQTTEETPTANEYLACIGFDIEINKIVVKQIQGSHGKEKTLSLVKWERMLLAILTDWAKKNGFKQVRIIQAKNSYWYRDYDEERTKRMFMHYDITARRSGFSFDQESGQYLKSIT